MIDKIDFILFAQHGWADTSDRISQLAQRLATANTLAIAPDLGWLNTWISIEPLIDRLESEVIEAIASYPHASLKIIGHSLGGLIWLELLDRHPQWWLKVHSLVLLGCPIGGAHLARIIDPLSIGMGIARDLGKNRRALAEKIAQHIPTLVIAGDLDRGSDGTVTVECTKFLYSQFVCLPNLRHAALKVHPKLDSIIENFWHNPVLTEVSNTNFSDRLIIHLRSIPGMTDTHWRNFDRAQVYLTFKNALTIRTWKNTLQVEHIFLANEQEQCLYAGFVGWLHNQELLSSLEKIQQQYSSWFIVHC
jgi:pimeloyl-ACP methyl ester carboxylesterase